MGVSTRVLTEAARNSFGRSMSLAGTVLYAFAEEKYLGIVKAKRGRIAGRQAQMIPTLTSTPESVAWSELSNVWSFEFARLSSEYSRIVEITMTLLLR
jgi:hypothetical protein